MFKARKKTRDHMFRYTMHDYFCYNRLLSTGIRETEPFVSSKIYGSHDVCAI